MLYWITGFFALWAMVGASAWAVIGDATYKYQGDKGYGWRSAVIFLMVGPLVWVLLGCVVLGAFYADILIRILGNNK